MSDRGYINLIRHLARPSSTLSLETLQASISHYLARTPAPLPGTPTPLAAAVLSSPLFQPYTHATLSALALAFRHAVHLHVGVLREEAERNPGGLLTRGVDVRGELARWAGEVRAGFTGSEPLVRLAGASGFLLGLEDWDTELKIKEKERGVRAQAEEEVVLALAEVVDEYAREGSGWEKDFRKTVGAKGDEDPLALAVLLASHCTQCIAAERLQALQLSTVIDVLMNTIDRSFYSGAFLTGASTSINADAQGRVAISPTSPFAQTLRSIATSPYIAAMSALARFIARALTVLVESRRASGWESIGRTLQRLQILTSTVEKDWQRCPLAQVTNEEDLPDGATRELATATWSMLKTLLFTTLMISQSVLSAVVFVPGRQASQRPSSSASPQAIALTVLHVLSHLSFVMPQLGGVASTSEGGLPELKRAFYMALDVLASSEDAAERFVSELCQREGLAGKGKGVDTLPRSLLDARKAFALACVEQLVPKLSEETIQTRVYPLCHPRLWDCSHRETYESAHSVMLAIFAAHAQAGAPGGSVASRAQPAFAEKLVPMYAQCLVENSSDERLSTTQLCMAYAALVRSANAFGDGDDESAEGDSMAWLCVEVLLDAIHHTGSAPSNFPEPPQSSSSASPVPATHSEHLHRLHLTLIALVPSVSLALMPRLMREVKAIVLSSPAGDQAGGKREELVQALFKAILQDVGDAEKEYAIGWWLENRESLARSRDNLLHNSLETEGTMVARL
ncbi:uncharacterized protein TRAVEDRAFT_147587 [Trametes versicolor FP-101664 SS1]|uniref:uncharacterized protein n=1 Tax=Trametes versicolor (strain FP-101664) TaxID=717944 RepID=UPI00046248E3|nr:uncharacterized protein TRAVEDRAFT_147587 [Trametes versicolor FP-101664 SS1]EIW59549.1 hypothetical protein TRAVEDRAFT_147587 [Trametes versicolor FP-101664 SS1]